MAVDVQILIYREVIAAPNRLFCVAFSKATARAALAQKRHFLFAKLFLLCLLLQKKKRLWAIDTKSF